jgi:hypothetical protein
LKCRQFINKYKMNIYNRTKVSVREKHRTHI